MSFSSVSVVINALRLRSIDLNEKVETNQNIGDRNEAHTQNDPQPSEIES